MFIFDRCPDCGHAFLRRYCPVRDNHDRCPDCRDIPAQETGDISLVPTIFPAKWDQFLFDRPLVSPYTDDREGPNWDEAREDALRRAGNICIHCEMHRETHKDVFGGDLHVHHIVPRGYWDNTEKMDQWANLVPLCTKHHAEWDKYPIIGHPAVKSSSWSD